MANLVISEKLLQQLRSVAEHQQRTVDELAEEALANYLQAATPEAVEAGEEQQTDGLFLTIAQMAEEHGWSSGITDISSNTSQYVEEAIAAHFTEGDKPNDNAEDNTDG